MPKWNNISLALILKIRRQHLGLTLADELLGQCWQCFIGFLAWIKLLVLNLNVDEI